ncbi:UDP-N-acetylglucosamine--N-acetylmuramyl-(pentapeptide) pyrophosphoryl-undecaprenol N-acetylglucosamine transferase [Thermotomaculum hydrothermale]|uniref:UDP-N-acetylglucosamine--N-acetylmuramyl-(pentapeptide) pyrophosphoryl-undecaprenol N-acetylglucosamine transferase n=1 Tax=Thermotomaculum hydrothermale TaxID=981385 RepID=A0A7R6T0D4_9BACT|nr:UDP-N-acetylglucosamine--N-acetylmuramyl-(pentapeptide) pyrophosphoryl-undecaprenol N-acetylglucosamine transferase [Thermotomaculum hydrothermale]BBB33587.1 UDP-N-acetylglucosamine--N-acetylmuramyl-(pentapeptide) pyrophosphoryl-undecaprenol N-acetylglucosamine transferase [Thermotomaculum hydrothermale]
MVDEKAIKKIKVLLTGGGTAGHVIPCIAIYNILKKHFEVEKTLYLGLKGKAEEVIVPKQNIPLEFIKTSPFAGKSGLNKFKALLSISVGVLQSIGKIVKFKPDLIVGAGGYVSAPVIVAGFLLKPFLKHRIVLDEQNLVPGLLNKVASLFADTVFVNFKESSYFIWSNQSVYTGYPVRSQYLEDYNSEDFKEKLGFSRDKNIVLITGGSLGARTLNRLVAASIKELSEFKNTFFVHSIGLNTSNYYNAFEDTLSILKKSGLEIEVKDDEIKAYKGNEVFYTGKRFIDNIFDWQKAADLIISRAGAGAISEILALGKASILVPKRGLPGDHQELNAIGIAEKEACEVLFEKRKNGDEFIEKNEFLSLLKTMLENKEKREEMGKIAKSLFFPKCEEIIVETVTKLLNGEDDEINFLTGVFEPQFVKFQRYFDNLVRYLDAIPSSDRGKNLYARFYSIKVEEFLQSKDFMTVNKGIKLVGALRLEKYYSFLWQNFKNFKGYLRRNTLIAFRKSEKFFPEFVNIIESGLNDSYFEARREAIALFRRFYKELSASDNIKKKILENLDKRFESFEVIAESIKASAFILDEDSFIKLNKRFLTHKNVRIREALLDAVRLAIDYSSFSDIEKLTVFLKKMLITTSEFKPVYSVREKYFKTLKILEGKND